MDTKTIGKWLYYLGLLVAVVITAFKIELGDWVSLVLLIAGILAGVFCFDTEDVNGYVIRYAGLYMTQGLVNDLPVVGEYLTSIFGATVGFLGPIVLTVLVMRFINKAMGK